MMMAIAEYLEPLMPYSVVITLIGLVITWIYKKSKIKGNMNQGYLLEIFQLILTISMWYMTV